jgi:hypothetical protein
VYAAKSRDDTTVVAVSAFASDAALPCEAEEEGVEVTAFETSRGLQACSVSARTDESAFGFGIVFVRRGETIVTVNVIAPAPSVADLAKSVADSVELRQTAAATPVRFNVPEPEPKLIGCFERDASVRGAVIYWQRCFAEDFTFTQEYGFGMSTIYTDLAGRYLDSDTTTDRRAARGTWLYSEGTLQLLFDDGSELERSVRFAGEHLYLDDTLWQRL